MREIAVLRLEVANNTHIQTVPTFKRSNEYFGKKPVDPYSVF